MLFGSGCEERGLFPLRLSLIIFCQVRGYGTHAPWIICIHPHIATPFKCWGLLFVIWKPSGVGI